MTVQLTVEEHGFEQQTPTFMRVFSHKHLDCFQTAVESAGAEGWLCASLYAIFHRGLSTCALRYWWGILRHWGMTWALEESKSYRIFNCAGVVPLTPMLFKCQVYLGENILTFKRRAINIKVFYDLKCWCSDYTIRSKASRIGS